MMLMNLKRVLISLIFLSFFLFFDVSAHQELLIEERGGVALRVIKVVLDGEHFVVSSVADDGGETLVDLMNKVWGTSAINGAFFCPKDYTSCWGNTFSRYERVFKGEGEAYSMFWPDTSIRGIFGFERDGKPLFVQNKISEHDIWLENNINQDKIDDLYFGISNFPVLLIEGENVTAGASNYIDSKMTWKANRNFICSTEDGSTIYMGYVGYIGIREIADYLKEYLGCYNALWLDAGASSAMIYDKRLLSQGSRSLITDAFVVVDRETYLDLLDGKAPKHPAKYTPEYELTSQDRAMIQVVNALIQDILVEEGKEIKSQLISLIRSAVSSSKMSLQRKAIFNQVLIDLFTIKKV